MPKPSYVAYFVRSREGQKDYWNRIGAAVRHKDGKGFDFALDGKIALRLAREKDEGEIQA